LSDFVIAVINRPFNHPINHPSNPPITHQITKSFNHQIAGREARQ